MSFQELQCTNSQVHVVPLALWPGQYQIVFHVFVNTWGIYHLHGKSGWNGTLVTVQDFPGMAFRQAPVSGGWEKTIRNQNGGCSDKKWEKGQRCSGSSGSLQMVQDFSGHSGWNRKRGIRLRISIFFGNVPVE